MRVPRIYTEQELTPNSELLLEEAPSHHILKVLRMDVGRDLILFNGHGCEYSARITDKNKKHAVLAVTEYVSVDNESPLKTHLAIAISRGDRFDIALQKATELGVTEITPLFTERTEVRLKGERLIKKMDAWRKLIIGACEQSGRCVVPTLHPATDISEFVPNHESECKFVLHHRSEKALNTFSPANELTLLIGPEGGLSETEIGLAQTHDFSPLRLGPRVLRTETAPLAALAIFQSLWGDF